MWGFFGLMFVLVESHCGPGGLEFTTFTSLALNSGRPPCSFLCLRMLELKVYTTHPFLFFCWFLLSVCLFYLLRKKINAYVSKISENKEGDYFIYMNHMDLLINLIVQIF